MNQIKKFVLSVMDYFRRPDYLYHGTSLAVIPSIQNEGLDPRYFKRAAVFFSDNMGFAALWGNLEVLVRVNTKDLDKGLLKKSIGYTGEYKYEGIIPPEVIDIMMVSLDKTEGRLRLSSLK